VLSPLAAVLRLASFVICLIVVASFVLFVVNQTSSASTHQQEELRTGATPAKKAPKHESTARKTIDEASKTLTSPFSGITAGSSSQWLIRGVNLALALLVYGFGLAFLARVIRVRT
jgi:hypothetical protein